MNSATYKSDWLHTHNALHVKASKVLTGPPRGPINIKYQSNLISGGRTDSIQLENEAAKGMENEVSMSDQRLGLWLSVQTNLIFVTYTISFAIYIPPITCKNF